MTKIERPESLDMEGRKTDVQGLLTYSVSAGIARSVLDFNKSPEEVYENARAYLVEHKEVELPRDLALAYINERRAAETPFREHARTRGTIKRPNIKEELRRRK